jgi:hypothetical protein
MAGLVQAIHVFAIHKIQVVDARDERGHDGMMGFRPSHSSRQFSS